METSRAVAAYAAAEALAITAEAIALWSADPLPVGDLEYAARMVTGTSGPADRI